MEHVMEHLNLAHTKISPLIQKFFNDNGHIPQEYYPIAGKAASSRLYYRIPGIDTSWIVMQAAELDHEFERFIFITALFSRQKIAVPQIYCVDREYKQMAIQDLGITTLWNTWHLTKTKEVYIEAINALIRLQKNVVVTPDLLSEPAVFDVHMLKWETGYFFQNYILKYLFPTEQQQILLNHEFNVLAVQVDAHPKVMMHRDFQSQNIMIQNSLYYLIDYQGARLGSWCYDLASLLWDPYIEMSPELLWELTHYYYEASAPDMSYDEFKNQFIEASLQRVMQACGAYCFLSDTKGKTEFKQFLKPGLHALKLVLHEYDGLAMLKKILE